MFKLLKFIYWFVLKRSNFSQNNEEEILLNLFKDKKNGFYVDVGCHHPKRFSNTAALYKKGWSGINIDPDLTNLKLWNLFRKRDLRLDYFISNKEKEVQYHIFKDKALNGNLKKDRIKILKNLGHKLQKTKKLKTITLDKILKTYRPELNEIDLLDIDVEGYDLDVLKSINLKRYRVNVIIIEIGHHETEIDTYLEKYDYKSHILVDRNKFYIKN